MEALKPRPPAVIIPDLGNSEKSFCGLCLVSNTGHLELLHHNFSAQHVKKLRTGLRLQSQCTVCRVHISDLKAAEAHVQDCQHEKRMNYNFSLKEAASVVDQIYKCPPCHLVFTSCIGHDLHMLMTHKVRFSKENLPELSEIIWLLSGSSFDASKVNINPECDLCNLRCEAMDDFLMHLLSNEHMKPMRTSTCILCELTFIHVNDRESHLHASKHKVNLQKFCLTKRLRKLNEMEQVENIGYICMYCMIRCKSWPCFILHLIGTAHIACAEIQDRQQIVHAELQAEVVETDENSPVSSISGKNWKRWLDHSTALSAWCLVCEEMVSTPETLEKHLKGHNGEQSIHIKRSRHRINTLFKEEKACDYPECEVCCVVFKNEFSLAVHKAFRQHHIQQALMSNGGISCPCYDCRMRGTSRAIEQIILPKSNSVIVDGHKLEENVTTVQLHSAKELKSEVNKASSVKMFSQTSESMRFKDSHEVDEISPPGQKTEIDASHQANEDKNSEHLTGCHETDVLVCQEQTLKMVPVVIAAALPPSNSIHNSIESALKLVKESLSAAVPKIRKSSSGVFSVSKRLKGNIYDTAVDKHDCRSLQPILEAAVSEGLQAFISQSNLHEASTLVEKSDNITKPTHQTSSSTCDMQNGSCGSPVSVSIENIGGVSVAFAAAIIPQYSTTQIALQTCTTNKEHPSLSRSNHEKEHETSVDHQESSGLRKVFKETNSHDAKPCIQDSNQHETSMDHQESTGLRKVFKETNCHDAKQCIQDSIQHETSMDHQESSGLRKVFKETKCHDSQPCMKDSTQRIKVVYEEDTSSDSDDYKVYVSPNDTESSED